MYVKGEPMDRDEMKAMKEIRAELSGINKSLGKIAKCMERQEARSLVIPHFSDTADVSESAEDAVESIEETAE